MVSSPCQKKGDTLETQRLLKLFNNHGDNIRVCSLSLSLFLLTGILCLFSDHFVVDFCSTFAARRRMQSEATRGEERDKVCSEVSCDSSHWCRTTLYLLKCSRCMRHQRHGWQHGWRRIKLNKQWKFRFDRLIRALLVGS